MQVHEKIETTQIRITVFFQCFVAPECSGESKSRLAKAAGAEPSGQMRDEKLHAVVAQSTFRSQNREKTVGFGALLEKLRVDMLKKTHAIVTREAHSEVKMRKNTRIGAFLGAEMFKKCTPLWREPHFDIKMSKTHQVWTTFGR